MSAREEADYVSAARVEDVPDGTLLGVEVCGTPICLYNDGGAIGAVADVCTHAEFAMSDGLLRGDGTIECAWHGARFRCASGAVVRGPATDALPVYDVRVENGVILVGGRR